MIPLSIPWLLLALVTSTIVLIFKRKWKAACLIMISILLLNFWYECIPLRFISTENEEKGQTIRAMSFNINGSSEDILTRLPEIIDFVTNNKPDVIFIAEYPELYYNKTDTLLKKYFRYSTQRDGSGHYFFSKYPISDQQWFSKGEEKLGVYRCTVYVDNDSIMLYGCHFASNNYTESKKYVTPDSIRDSEDVMTYYRNIHLAYKQREHESLLIVDDIKDKNVPVVVMGDFNDVGGSAAVKALEGTGLKDAWWEGGFGYGATIHKPLPYRIDHIMYSSGIELRKIDVISSEGLSDHDALYAEFGLKAN